MSYEIEERVSELELALRRFINESAIINKQADERNRDANERMASLGKEMRDLNKAADERMAGLSKEMQEFKIEMRQSKRDLDKKWGDLANKMGTIIEDILAPNLLRLATEHFGFKDIVQYMLRRRQKLPGGKAETEFDTIIVGPEAVILGEAKSSPCLAYIDEFIQKVPTFFNFCPEYKNLRLIPVFGSWSIDDKLVERLTEHKIYAMRMGDDIMELVNAGELEKSGD